MLLVVALVEELSPTGIEKKLIVARAIVEVIIAIVQRSGSFAQPVEPRSG